jgi:hypothetical protein
MSLITSKKIPKKDKTLNYKNPVCQWCTKESVGRAAIRMDPNTKPEDAHFMHKGMPMGYCYWCCEKCLGRLNPIDYYHFKENE